MTPSQHECLDKSICLICKCKNVLCLNIVTSSKVLINVVAASAIWNVTLNKQSSQWGREAILYQGLSCVPPPISRTTPQWGETLWWKGQVKVYGDSWVLVREVTPQTAVTHFLYRQRFYLVYYFAFFLSRSWQRFNFLSSYKKRARSKFAATLKMAVDLNKPVYVSHFLFLKCHKGQMKLVITSLVCHYASRLYSL